MWWGVAIDVAKALLNGEIKRWWAEHKQRKAINEQNQVNSLSDDSVSSGLSKWTKPD